jgi:tetratricopeptide (TPR) repeat protein
LTEQYANSEKIFLKVLSMYRLPWTVLGLGKTYFYTRRFMDARDTFKSLIQDNDQFIPAYDWLSRTLEELGDKRGAQSVLEDAIKISPKAILRQRALGTIAFINKDYNAAETSFKKAVKLGKTSLFKDSADYSQLAKVLVNKQSLPAALKIVAEMRTDFADSDEVILQATLLESDIYTESNQKDKAMKNLLEAEKLYNQMEGNVSPNIAIDIARSFIKSGEKAKGMALMEYVIKNNHANKDVLKKIQDTFNTLGIGEEGVDFISNTRTEIIKVNNLGVEFIEQGKYVEAIGLFEKAADGLPSNVIINLNAMRSMVGYMQKKGRDDKLLFKCEKYIKRVESIDPDNVKYQQLLTAYRALLRRPDTED